MDVYFCSTSSASLISASNYAKLSKKITFKATVTVHIWLFTVKYETHKIKRVSDWEIILFFFLFVSIVTTSSCCFNSTQRTHWLPGTGSVFFKEVNTAEYLSRSWIYKSDVSVLVPAFLQRPPVDAYVLWPRRSHCCVRQRPARSGIT